MSHQTELLEETQLSEVTEKVHSLIEVCDHEALQAEQCTYLVHFKGKCDVMTDTFNNLKPFRNQLLGRGLTATID
jgi:ATP-dependent Clp protease adaptor protein ClpS